MKPSQYSREIGRRIREARETKKLSLEGLAKLTGGLLTKSRIGNYEQGTRMPGPAEINAIAAVLDTDAAYLMCLALGYTKQELDLVRYFRTLPENYRSQYFSRLQNLSLVYREPLPDEKLTPAFRSPAPQQLDAPVSPKPPSGSKSGKSRPARTPRS